MCFYRFRHLEEVNETWGEHACQALKYAAKLGIATMAVFVHAFIPDLFPTTASNICVSIANDVNTRQKQK